MAQVMNTALIGSSPFLVPLPKHAIPGKMLSLHRISHRTCMLWVSTRIYLVEVGRREREREREDGNGWLLK